MGRKCFIVFCAIARVLIADANGTATSSLKKADYYANLYNWADAGPFFLRADRELKAGSPEQIHAHLGYLRATMETRSLPDLSNYLSRLLQSPVMASNPQLRLWCLPAIAPIPPRRDGLKARI